MQRSGSSRVWTHAPRPVCNFRLLGAQFSVSTATPGHTLAKGLLSDNLVSLCQRNEWIDARYWLERSKVWSSKVSLSRISRILVRCGLEQYDVFSYAYEKIGVA
jgi:hypothetical protein